MDLVFSNTLDIAKTSQCIQIFNQLDKCEISLFFYCRHPLTEP